MVSVIRAQCSFQAESALARMVSAGVRWVVDGVAGGKLWAWLLEAELAL
jgi:hypothetical protein